MSFWHPSWAVRCLPCTLSRVECPQMKSTNRTDSSWHSRRSPAVQLSRVAVIFRQYEGVLFWPPVNECKKWDCICAREDETVICFLNTFFVLLSLVLDIPNNTRGLRRPAGYVPLRPQLLKPCCCWAFSVRGRRNDPFKARSILPLSWRTTGSLSSCREWIEDRRRRVYTVTSTCPLPQDNLPPEVPWREQQFL